MFQTTQYLELTTITYRLSGGATSANFVGLPPNLARYLIHYLKNIAFWFNNWLNCYSNNNIYYTVTTSGTCAPQTEIGDITIIPIASVDVTSVSSTLNQTICDGDDITPITFDIGEVQQCLYVRSSIRGYTGTYRRKYNNN